MKHHNKKCLIIICLAILALVGSNILWYKMYKHESAKLKNSIIPSLSNDYYSSQLTLTNNSSNQTLELPNLKTTKESILNQNFYLDRNAKLYEVPLILQNPKYPNGCEAASAVMLLNYYGISITLDEFINLLPKSLVYEKNGVRYGPNPAKYYAGDPSNYSYGWGCFDTVIASTINKILESNNSYLKSNSSDTKTSLDILAYHSPCLIWTTINYNIASDIYTWSSYDKKETYTYPKDEHVVVLTGYDNDYYYINDPLKENKNIKIPKSILENSFDSLGRQYVLINLK